MAIITGNDTNDTLAGTVDADDISGLNGDDLLAGGDGADTANGNPGNDVVSGDNGDDQVFGGQGDDSLHGNEGNDRIVGDYGNDSADGGNGHDLMEGYDGDDSMVGVDGNDYLLGNRGNDVLSAGNGDDWMRGGQGDDRLYGNNGHDLMFGDLGADTMTGGSGNDTYGFAPASGSFNPSSLTSPDQITDFDLSGDDRLDLGAAANSTNFINSGQASATLAGAAALADARMDGTVIYVVVNVATGLGHTSDNPVVFWDTDGNGSPDMAIALVNTPAALIQADDII
jgi:Ca2+-binding RTX toxin-like protein